MSLSSLALDASWVDYYGAWNAFNEPLYAPIELSTCHAPRLALIPEVQSQTIPPSGKIEYNFFLVAGSLIWGLWVKADFSGAMQLTDVSLEHAFFQEPLQVSNLRTLGANLGRFWSYLMLPTPHPVVGDGLFTLEVWGTAADVFYAMLGVAEVTDCPVK